ncbi:NAD(P)-dependent oxidoreductase [Actinokineospora enzanensis]|uniref:NAD(P)-dependent oxidoreductase n=1 Tax=Actinokineospora enzanensis TaxID=155975 RepID=UPI000373EBE8|nr:NAD(P)H-binding protein [Actinokineospora enzanensis]
MRVAVFGATGGTGRRFVERALAEGHRVVALARRPEALAIPGVDVLAGDVHDPDAVRRTVSGAEAVVSALGIGMRRYATTVYSAGSANIADAMVECGVRRLLVVSTTSLELPSRKRFAEWALARFVLHNILRAPYADMAEMERVVRATGLEWTVVRAARLTNGPSRGRYRVAYDRKLPGCWSISRADLAQYLLTSIGAENTVRRVAEVAY